MFATFVLGHSCFHLSHAHITDTSLTCRQQLTDMLGAVVKYGEICATQTSSGFILSGYSVNPLLVIDEVVREV